jgi:AcrR family transcriptional regulator
MTRKAAGAKCFAGQNSRIRPVLGSDRNRHGEDEMVEGSIDRRAVRTRAKMHQALVSLILKKDYDAITVEDICAAADIGRSTFYAHFSGKDDLKRNGLEQLRRTLLDQQRNCSASQAKEPRETLRFTLSMFQHAREHIDHYRALSGNRGGALALGVIRQMLSELFRSELVGTADANAEVAAPRELVLQYMIGAYMAVLIWWLDGGAKLPPEHVDAMFRRLATSGVAFSS